LKVSPVPCYFLPLRPKYFPQVSVLKHPQPQASLNVKDQVSNPYKNRHNYTSASLNLYTFKLQTGREKTEC
jgi:hypothetical protein